MEIKQVNISMKMHVCKFIHYEPLLIAVSINKYLVLHLLTLFETDFFCFESNYLEVVPRNLFHHHQKGKLIGSLRQFH